MARRVYRQPTNQSASHPATATISSDGDSSGNGGNGDNDSSNNKINRVQFAVKICVAVSSSQEEKKSNKKRTCLSFASSFPFFSFARWSIVHISFSLIRSPLSLPLCLSSLQFCFVALIFFLLFTLTISLHSWYTLCFYSSFVYSILFIGFTHACILIWFICFHKFWSEGGHADTDTDAAGGMSERKHFENVTCVDKVTWWWMRKLLSNYFEWEANWWAIFFHFFDAAVLKISYVSIS